MFCRGRQQLGADNAPSGARASPLLVQSIGILAIRQQREDKDCLTLADLMGGCWSCLLFSLL